MSNDDPIGRRARGLDRVGGETKAKRATPTYVVTEHRRTASYVVERKFPGQANMVVAVYPQSHQAGQVADELNRWAGVEKV